MPHRMTLRVMAELIQSRALSPVELLDAHLQQIDRVNPRVNAFVEVYAEQALRRARGAEAAARRGEIRGPLHGVPVTVKDSFDLIGRPTNCGSLLRRREIAQSDATVVQRLRGAGAVLLAKTSTPEFLYNYETDNHLIGRTNNPWDVDRTSGGSSGGEAAAIASCCSAGGVGSDGGGSIREPAHFCGICGLKPTPGRVAAGGHWPEIVNPTGFQGVVGPMARTAGDVRVLFEVLAGPDSRDPFSAPVPIRPTNGLPEVVAVWQPPRTEPAVRDAVDRAARFFEQMGCRVEPVDDALLAEAHDLWKFLFIDFAAPGIRAMIDGREKECHWTGLELIDMMKDRPAPSARQLCDVLLKRDHLRTRVLEFFERCPLVIAPGFGVAAFPHRCRQFSAGDGPISLFDAIRPVSPANLLGLPSMAIPVMLTGGGLPAGVQLMGAPYSEEFLLSVAERFEGERGDFPMPHLVRTEVV